MLSKTDLNSELKINMNDPVMDRRVYLDMLIMWLVSIGVLSCLAAMLVSFIRHM